MPHTSSNRPRPFLKWAGGKQQLLPKLHRRLPKGNNNIKNYFEIFGGGGALLFSLFNKLKGNIFFSDSSKLLINAYTVVRDDVEDLIEHLREHENTREYFDQIRDWDRDSSYANRTSVERASRLIYLNKTCYNGLFRVNASGEFNVPFGGYKNPNFCDETNLRHCSQALQNVDIQVVDYWEVLEMIGAKDFVYMDPPYEPLSATSGFRSYTETGFDEVDQVKLFKFLSAADS